MAVKPKDHAVKKPIVKEVEGGKQIRFPGIQARTDAGKPVEKDGNPVSLTVTVLAEALDDFELLDDMRAMDQGNSAKMPAILRRLVGDDYKAVINAVRDPETGRVTITAMLAWINALLEALNPNS